ncbi:Na+/H+ antiporter NhaA [Prolixibacteraceae bacterium Z1-6]|uniref:Na(+)/H(+) antiporter NhaA n=1 Tax=Draconibacterium aestuarii TaxID=2998507 RepID=A0A9X3F5U5_9BACT|nr:Na+/H+ antiporter NhaA [Prolixibacteraceae bacterium Z1-6]
MKINFDPFLRFIKIKSLSSIVMLVTSMAALYMANSRFASMYQEFLELEFTIGFSEFHLTKSILHWVNDGLMAVFFFLIGLEIKSEFITGSLNSIRRAVLPIFAAIGGMVVPIIIFLVLNHNQKGIEGWGIPMATDIAFSIGVLGVFGSRVPLGLKIFLTTYAIIDDLGAIIIIALFYSSSIDWHLVIIALILLSVLFILTALNIYWKYFFLFSGIIIWLLFLKSGIHPTVAGVLVSFTIPLQRKKKFSDVIRRGRKALNELSLMIGKKEKVFEEHKDALHVLDTFTSSIYSPLQYLQYRLQGLVAFLIIPLFGFANAGITFTAQGSAISPLTLNIAVSLLFGKVIGISLFTYLTVKLKIGVLPLYTNFNQIIGLGFLGGLGFTMSIFIANLAYDSADMINSSKIGILLGSMIAAILGLTILKFSLKKKLNLE